MRTVAPVLLAVGLAFAGLIAKGQSSLIDVVYLKNGSIIKGIIVEQVPGQAVKLQTADGSLFVFEMEEITKMTREAPTTAAPVQPQNNNAVQPRNLDDWGRTYVHNMDISERRRAAGIGLLSTGGALAISGATLLGLSSSTPMIPDRSDRERLAIFGYIAAGASIPFLATGGAALAKSVLYRKRAEAMQDGSVNILPVIIDQTSFSGAQISVNSAAGLRLTYNF